MLINNMRNTKHALCFTAILFLIGVFYLAGCSSTTISLGYNPEEAAKAHQELTEFVEAEISDSDRKQPILEIIQGLDHNFKERNNLIVDFKRKMKSLNDDYNAERVDFENLYSELYKNGKKIRGEILLLMHQIKSKTTKKEWGKMAPLVENYMSKSLL